jgi:hypothetical protein
MRIVFTSVLVATLAIGGVAAAQVTGISRATTRSAYMVEPFTPPTPITINGTGVRLRAEPFATNDTPVLSTGSTGLQLTVVGLARQADWNWYQVILRNGQKAFIRSDLTSAPMRGDAAANYVAPVQPVQPVPQVVYNPPSTPQPPIPQVWTPPQQPSVAAQPLPPIPTQPVQGGGAISLTPGGSGSSQRDLPRAATPSQPVDNGLISIAPTAPIPRLSDPVGVAPSSTVGGGDIGQQIRAQLDAKRCWTDSGNMMDAQRLRATFGVMLNPDGRFASEPRLISPTAEPAGDPAMMVFLAKARAAMRTCNNLGFDVPAGGAQGEIRLDFSAR